MCIDNGWALDICPYCENQLQPLDCLSLWQNISYSIFIYCILRNVWIVVLHVHWYFCNDDIAKLEIWNLMCIVLLIITGPANSQMASIHQSGINLASHDIGVNFRILMTLALSWTLANFVFHWPTRITKLCWHIIALDFSQIWYFRSPRRIGLLFRLQMFKIGQKVNLKNFGVFEQIYWFGNIWME